MKKTFLCTVILSLFFCCTTTSFAAKNYFKIVDSGITEITFESVSVDAGSIEEQIEVVINTTDKEYSGVIAYVIDSVPPNDWKKQLPYTSWVNPSFIIRYEIAYSPSNNVIAIERILDNRSVTEESTWDVDEKTITLEWYLIKDATLK